MMKEIKSNSNHQTVLPLYVTPLTFNRPKAVETEPMRS